MFLPTYNVNGNICIRVIPSTTRWTKNISTSIQFQMRGFENDDTTPGTPYTMDFADYALLRIESKPGVWVPGCSYYLDQENLYVDLDRKIGIQFGAAGLTVQVVDRLNISLPYLIQFLLLAQQKTFVHAAGVSIAGEGVLLPAFGGVGKTAFVAEIAKRPRVKILGDDLVILRKDGHMEPYLRPFCLYEYHKSLFPAFFENTPVKIVHRTLPRRLERKLYQWLGSRRFLSFGFDFVTATPRELFGVERLERNAVPLKRIYCLRRESGISSLQIVRGFARDKLVAFLTAVLQREWHEYLGTTFTQLALQEKSAKSYYDIIEDIIYQSLSAVRAQDLNLVRIPLLMDGNSVASALCEIVYEGK